MKYLVGFLDTRFVFMGLLNDDNTTVKLRLVEHLDGALDILDIFVLDEADATAKTGIGGEDANKVDGSSTSEKVSQLLPSDAEGKIANKDSLGRIARRRATLTLCGSALTVKGVPGLVRRNGK